MAAVRNLRIVGGAKGGAGGERTPPGPEGPRGPPVVPGPGGEQAWGGPCRPSALPSLPQGPLGPARPPPDLQVSPSAPSSVPLMAMASPPAPPAKKRKMNFSEREVEIIVEELERGKHLLINHFNAGVPLAAKAAAWHDILRRVNAVATCHRELPEVKKKWSDLKTEVRRKVAQVRAAMEGGGESQNGNGNGPESEDPTGAATAPVILTPMQQRICNLLGEATIISLPSGDCSAGDGTEIPITASATTVTLTQSECRAC